MAPNRCRTEALSGRFSERAGPDVEHEVRAIRGDEEPDAYAVHEPDGELGREQPRPAGEEAGPVVAVVIDQVVVDGHIHPQGSRPRCPWSVEAQPEVAMIVRAP